MQKSYRIVAYILVLLILVSVSGCGSAEQPPENTDTAVVLKVVTSYGGDDGNRIRYEEAVRLYESRTGNTVADYSETSSEEWKAKVMTDFETASEPDVLFFFTDNDAEPLICAGKVVSIEEIRTVYPDYASNMKESMLAVAEDGNCYAVPAYGYWENLFVNTAVLEACGVEMPGSDYTWDRFISDCEQIRSRGYVPIACSLKQVPHYWFEFAVMNNGSVDNHYDVPQLDSDGNLIMNAAAEKWINALNDIKELYERGFFPPDTLATGDTEASALFAEGKAAFIVDGSWKVGWLESNYPGNIDDYAVTFMPAKGSRSATETIGGLSMGYFITRKAWDNPQKRQAAVDFVSCLTFDEVLNTFVTTEITALADGTSKEGLSPLQQSAAENNARITEITGAVQDTLTAEIRSALFSNIQYVVTGKMSAQEAVAEALRSK